MGDANQGVSVAISADGNTAIVGGPGDGREGDPFGAAWVFTRSGGVWSQQGAKLVGTGAAGGAGQGRSVAISADGNTAVVGGPADDCSPFSLCSGAAWVFTRSGGVWSQQGPKLVGTGEYADGMFSVSQGSAVAISGDGNTVVIGGPGDSGGVGAAWVFARAAGVWSQQGVKLVGMGADAPALQGYSVAVSADGSSLVVGGPYDGSDGSRTGAAWVFTRSGVTWAQQGDKLVGTGAVGNGQLGYSVAISGDGNTVVAGAPDDETNFAGSGPGATWVFQRVGGTWSQLGSKLVGTGAAGGYGATQGTAVSISADGGTAIVGGPSDSDGLGAAWVFASPALDVWVPVASHNPGLNGSEWHTDLELLNTGTTTADAQIRFPAGGGAATIEAHVPPGAQTVLRDVVAQLGASGSGAIEIVSSQPVEAASRTYNQVSPTASCFPGGTQGQDYPVLEPSEGLAAGESAFLVGLAENAQYRCNVGLVNTGTEDASVHIELVAADGGVFHDYTVDLRPGEWAQEVRPFLRLVPRVGGDVTPIDSCYVKLTVQTGFGVFGFASLIDNITNDPTTVEMQR